MKDQYPSLTISKKELESIRSSTTPIIQRKIKAMESLAKTEIKYKKACIEKYGRYHDDESLYVKMIHDSWEEYKQSGCSLSMINDDVPIEFGYGKIHERLVEEMGGFKD